jgi:hypothetical protein
MQWSEILEAESLAQQAEIIDGKLYALHNCSVKIFPEIAE